VAALPFDIASVIPLATALGLARRLVWTWSTVILVSVITPVLDIIVGLNTDNPAEEPGGPPPQRDAV